MRRVPIQRRHNEIDRAREWGFDFHSIDGEVYWEESAYYAFSLYEIEQDIESVTDRLYALCVELAGQILNSERLLLRLKVPEHAWSLISESWRKSEPSLYGRFDLAYIGEGGNAKLLEFNADTPTSLFESAVFQWVWLEDAVRDGLLPIGTDQFNSIHEKLVTRLKHPQFQWQLLHLTGMLSSAEDAGQISYLENCAREAGLLTKVLDIADIGTGSAGQFADLQDEPINLLFKLYPWEWMFSDEFSHSASMAATQFIEPPWKAVLSNKGILPLLWEMEPGHPNLLPAYFDDDPRCALLGERYVRKPVYSREGSNILLRDGDKTIAEDGTYGGEDFIRQALTGIYHLDGNYAVLGSWIVGDQPAGVGIREDTSPITRNTSRFVPHAITE
jgi:glutathionylspermidine synthase